MSAVAVEYTRYERGPLRDPLRETLEQVRATLEDLQCVPKAIERMEARITREVERAREKKPCDKEAKG